MSPRQKILILSGVLFTSAVAGYTTVYLPFYSKDIQELNKQTSDGTRLHSTSPKGGSMWGNLDREIKEGGSK
jgi:hypothetical protein